MPEPPSSKRQEALPPLRNCLRHIPCSGCARILGGSWSPCSQAPSPLSRVRQCTGQCSPPRCRSILPAQALQGYSKPRSSLRSSIRRTCLRMRRQCTSCSGRRRSRASDFFCWGRIEEPCERRKRHQDKHCFPHFSFTAASTTERIIVFLIFPSRLRAQPKE